MTRYYVNRLYILFIIAFFLSTSNSYLYPKTFTLKWNKNPNSIRYVIELSMTKEFKVISKRLFSKVTRLNLNLNIGTYYVRVYGINKDKSKTKYSKIRKIIIRYNINNYNYKKGNKIYTQAYPKLDSLLKGKRGILYYKVEKHISAFKRYKKTKTLNIKKEGEYILYYYFSINGKNTNIKAIKLVIDNSYPSYNILLNNVIYKNSKNIRVPKGVDIVIDAKDIGSGVKEILYSYENNNVYYLYKDYISTLGKKKPFYIYFKLIDNVGNTSPIYRKRITLY